MQRQHPTINQKNNNFIILGFVRITSKEVADLLL